MILLLGASGYVGQAFASELRRRGGCFIPLTRNALDYTQFDLLFDYVRRMHPTFVINAAGWTGRPNVDACEIDREDTLFLNTLLPQTIARVCVMTGTPWGHVSSASIYCGAKVNHHGEEWLERDLNRPEVRRLLAESPESFRGFTERDEPNFSFRRAPCNFYAGTKALAEEAIRELGPSYIWRPGMTFHERDEPRNLLWKLQHYPRVCDHINSISHLADFVAACLDLWEWRAPFGIYNLTNPGWVTTRQVVAGIQRVIKPARSFEFWPDDAEFYRSVAKAPRSSCILDVSKLLATGVPMRPVEDALEEALHKWQPAGMVLECSAR